jgi:mono/diheme cytochrome c family protein
MRNMKRLAIAGLMLFSFLFIFIQLVVVASTSAPRRSHAELPGVRVEDLYNNNCARCHGGDGRGDTPLGHTYNAPDFTDLKWWQENSDITSTGSLISIVTRGKGGMPAFGKKLKRAEIQSLVRYMKKFKNQKSPN